MIGPRPTVDTDPPVSRDQRLRPNADLIVVMVLAIVCATATALIDARAPRIAAGLLLELALPGYALMMFVFARRGLDRVALVLGSLGSSLAISAVGGLLLDGLPGKMDKSTWTTFLLLATILFALGAQLWPAGNSPSPVDQTAAPAYAAPQPLTRSANCTWLLNGALGLLALLAIVGAVSVARGASDRHRGFTELSAIPVSSSRAPRLLVRVRSHEHHIMTFELKISENQRTTSTTTIILKPGREWRRLTPKPRPRTRRVLTELYRTGETVPYLRTSYYLSGRRSPTTQVSKATNDIREHLRETGLPLFSPARGGAVFEHLDPSRPTS